MSPFTAPVNAGVVCVFPVPVLFWMSRMIDPAPVPTVNVFGTPEYAAIQHDTTPPAACVNVGADSAPLSRFAKILTAHVDPFVAEPINVYPDTVDATLSNCCATKTRMSSVV